MSLFSVSSVLNTDSSLIIDSVKKTRKLIIVDDSRTIFKPFDSLLRRLKNLKIKFDYVVFEKKPSLESLKPNKDDFNIDIKSILKKNFLKIMIDKPKQAVILVSIGSRLFPLTKNFAKPMINVCGKPFLEHLVLFLKK